MKIKTDTRIIKAEHNGISFEYEGGILKINNKRYGKADIRILVEIANLLEVEGFKLKEFLSSPILNTNEHRGLITDHWEPYNSNDED